MFPTNPNDKSVETIDLEEFNKVIGGCLSVQTDDKGFFKLTDNHATPVWKKAIGRELANRGYYVRWISGTYAHFRKS